MTYSPSILALDLASRTGWALGEPSDPRPLSGSLRFAREGASMGAVFSGCRQWLSRFLAENRDIKLVVFEAPMTPQHMSGRTDPSVVRRLMGLCAVVEELCHSLGNFDVFYDRKAAWLLRSAGLGIAESRRVLSIISNCLLGW